MNPMIELMKELMNRVETLNEMIQEDPGNEYAQGRRDAFLRALTSCNELMES